MGKKCAKRFSLFILLTLLVLAFGIFLYHSAHRENTGGGPKSSPATLQLKAGKDNTSFPRSKVVFKGLPSFVPAEGRVPAFTIANPGWERYLSPDFDFRLFRETGAIKALQVIALGDQGVPDSFLSSILKDLDFTPPKRSGKPVLKDGFLMEKSIAGGVAEIVCYRTQKHNKIVAFVVVIN
jgi:flagellar FliL protein